MKIVLLEDIKGLGVRGDVCTVSDGYAMNFLIPRKKAVGSTEEQGNQVIRQRQEKMERSAEQKDREKQIFDTLPETLTIAVPVNEQGTPFSAIHGAVIAAQLAEQGIAAPAAWFSSAALKQTGEHAVAVSCRDMKKDITVIVTEKKQ